MYEGIIQDLIDELGRLPGVGPKSAQRIAFHIIASDRVDVARLAEVLKTVKERVKFCTTCGNISEDVLAIEKTREFKGKYHVLGGAISPIDGVGPENLRIKELMTRLAQTQISEIIIATDPNLEGEATATYLTRLIKPLGIKVSRLASGLPVGGDLEYADEITLGRAFEGRRSYDN
jgi:recombination protein RecR